MNEKNKWEHLQKYCENNSQEDLNGFYKNYYSNNSNKNKFILPEMYVAKRLKKNWIKFLIFIKRFIEKIADYFERLIIFTYKAIIVIAVLIVFGQIINKFDIDNTVASTNSSFDLTPNSRLLLISHPDQNRLSFSFQIA